ncbi:unnamed protein product [Candidula unifasciata]|uniref:Uncharacterized protein n=1 Tax=Candidula unifasciata TaxID=100452 RepID=A0A8S3YV92_9EUPU|nr:unnamed protein product [Candidula unifasciata]
MHGQEDREEIIHCGSLVFTEITGNLSEQLHIMDTNPHTGSTQDTDKHRQETDQDTDKHRQETDHHGYYCEKHPDDSEFIPVQKLCLYHLPSGYQSPHLISYIRAFANLLVSVLVNCVSEMRPEKSPGSDKHYPCHDIRGSKTKRKGTGFVSGVHIFPDEHFPEFTTCECAECWHLPILMRKRQFAHIAIRTATHLVFNKEEASAATCKIFIDNDGDSSVCGNGIEFSNMRYVTSSAHCDWCMMTYVTHDMGFVDRIQKLVTCKDNLKDILVAESLLSMCDDKKGNNTEVTRQGQLNITISHSNECDKRVSIVQHEYVNGTEAHSHSHIDAAVACPGSCGAPVQVIEEDWRLFGFEHTHSGHYESEVNFSSQGIGFTPFNHKHTEDKKNLDNNRCENKTTEECWSPAESNKEHEVNLKKHVVCRKNKGHTDFIPAPEFQMENLPPGFQNKKVMGCIQAVIALTVLVSVSYTSMDRPATFPFSSKPYTGYEYKGTNKKRTGTGLVQDIVRFPNEGSSGKETCPCEECKSSPSPKTEFAYVTVHSAAHVTFDDQEGVHTSCFLFFDKESSPELHNGVMELKRASRVLCDDNKDTSKMIFVTHNLSIIDKLGDLVGHWKGLQQKLEHGFIISSSKCEKTPSGPPSQVGSNHDSNHDSTHDSTLASNLISNHNSIHGSNHNSNNDSNHESSPGSKLDSNLDSNHASSHGLTVIVSHPHGCSKHVSIGYCISMDATGSGYTECQYTTPTCPGSSGAYVFVVGKFWKCWNKHHYGVQDKNSALPSAQ